MYKVTTTRTSQEVEYGAAMPTFEYNANINVGEEPMSPSVDSGGGSRHRRKKSSRHRREESGEEVMSGDGAAEGSSERRHRRHRSKRGEGDASRGEGGEEDATGGDESGERRKKKRRHRNRDQQDGEVGEGNVEATIEYGMQPPEGQFEYQEGEYPQEYHDETHWQVNVGHDVGDGEQYNPGSDEDEQHIGGDGEENQYHGPGAVLEAAGDVEIPADAQKKKKSGGGFSKFLSSFRRKGSKNKSENGVEGGAHENWESNPRLFMPNVESQAGTLEPSTTAPKPAKSSKFGIKSATTRPVAGLEATVILLDGDQLTIGAQKNFIGADILKRVCDELNIVEMDYFGLTWTNSKLKTWFWLDMEKKITKQLKHGEPWTFYFQVKFYPPEPSLVQEDITRYQLCLQLRHDIYTGKLPCSWVTHALLGSYMVQSELGDYIPSKYDGEGMNYIREFEFYHKQTEEMLTKIVELHKTLVGMTPDQADIKYMETAKRLEHYGVDLHPAWDSDNVQIFVGVSFYGVFVYKDRLRLSRFAWPKILRISYKKNFFYLKIRSDIHENVEGVIGFRLLTHHFAKRLWKNAIEHHTFFRLKETKFANTTGGAKLFNTFTLGSKYRFSGRTFFQHRTMSIERAHPNFERTMSKRQLTASMPMGMNQGGSMQYGSMHSLHRAHPRDMTIGNKAPSVEYLGPRQLGGGTVETGGTAKISGGLYVKNQQQDASPASSRRGGAGSDAGSQQYQPQASYTGSVTSPTANRAGRPQPQGMFSPPPVTASGRPGRPNATAVPVYTTEYTVETTYANMPDPSRGDVRYQHEEDYGDDQVL